MTGRRRYISDAWRLAAALAGLLFVVFLPFLIGSASLMVASRDAASIYPTGALPQVRPDGTSTELAQVQRTYDYSSAWLGEPSIAVLHRLVYEQHALPMWDPYEAYGMPFAAAMQPQPFYPLTLIAAAHPNPVLYDWYLVSRLFLAALGTALFVRLFSGFVPALAAGATSAFGCYYMIYYDMEHLSVETLFPALLFAIELVLRRASVARAAFLAAVCAGTFLGGMPESTALAGIVAAAYAVTRIVATRREPLLAARAGAVVASAALGIAISAIVLMPFVEFLSLSFDVHQARNTGGAIVGLIADGCLPGCLPTFISPIALGPPWNSLVTGFAGPNLTSGGASLIALWLSGIAVLAAIRALAKRQATALHAVALFLAAAAAVFEAKRFGFVLVEWTGSLPVLNLIVWPKYGEAIFTACVAILVGFGVHETLRSLRRDWIQHAADLGAAVFVTAALLAGINEVKPGAAHDGYFYGSFAAGAAIFAAAVAARHATRLGVLRVRTLAWIITALVVVQAVTSYAVPIFYFAAPQPPAAANPYARPPYLAAIADGVRSGYRVLGTQGAFHTNWPGAFGVPAIAADNAMYAAPYVTFIRAFVRDPAVLDIAGTPLDYASTLTMRLLRLSSVRYVVAPKGTPIPVAGGIAFALWEHNRTLPAQATGTFRLQVDRIGATSEQTIFAHPPQRDVTLDVPVAAHGAAVLVDAGIMPAAYLTNACAAAVRFTIEAQGRGARARTSVVLDPKRVPSDRRWVPLRLDLQRFAGGHALLRFITEPAKDGVLCNAWAEWGNPRVLSGLRAAQPYTKVADDPVTILRFADPMPRATVFRDVRPVSGDAAAIALMTSPAFRETSTALVAADAQAPLPPLTPCTGRDTIATRFDRSDHVTIDAALGCRGLVMLNDTFYPGWRAWVDGKEEPVVRTDVLFRGVVVDAGRHTVVFAYRSRTVDLGVAVSAVALAIWTGLLVAAVRRSVDRNHRRSEPVKTNP